MYYTHAQVGFPGGSEAKNLPAKAGDASLIPELGRSLEKEVKTHPVFLPGKPEGQRSLAGLQTMGSQKNQI